MHHHGMLPAAASGLRCRSVQLAPGTAQPVSHTPQDVHRCPSRRPSYTHLTASF